MKQFRYYSGEEGIEGYYTERKMYRCYIATVDKEEYSSYEGWKWDMLRSGTFKGLN